MHTSLPSFLFGTFSSLFASDSCAPVHIWHTFLPISHPCRSHFSSLSLKGSMQTCQIWQRKNKRFLFWSAINSLYFPLPKKGKTENTSQESD